ncbi:MAG TPA: non-homologous end-joining DNA ligase [Pyrinomonadaceae bacterium]|jgi:bifunctional non-homologous end joining protein LigD
MGLETYQQKRDFTRTPEPKGKLSKANRRRFVVQEHHASKLHFDFRLEMGGVLKSWSVPKGPSLDPAAKRFAAPTEDHPVEYLKFEGHIPPGNYGAGEHMIWDEGTYELLDGGDPLQQLANGKLAFRLKGKKLRGAFNLVRMSGREGQWLLIKSRDEHAEPGWQLTLRMDTDAQARAWQSGLQKGRAPRGASRPTQAARAARKHGVKRISTAGADAAVVPASRAFKAKELHGDVNVRMGRHTVALTNLDKVYWPDDGYTKADLIRYYYEISAYILPYLKDRPLIMKRYPNGIKGPFFHQHDVNEAPDFVQTATLDVEEGHTVDYIIGGDLPTLIYMANLGAIERHPWHSRLRNLARPDWFVFDLDPGPGVEFTTICELAISVRDLLTEIGLACYPKTSGSRGLHVYVPIKPVYDYEQIAELAEQVATLVARAQPEIATVERALKKRKRGQIYVDHMQNARGKSVVAPYSVRPRAGACVSAPLTWREVERKRITPQDFTIKNLLRRVRAKGDLFEPVRTSGQRLERAMKEVARRLAVDAGKRAA